MSTDPHTETERHFRVSWTRPDGTRDSEVAVGVSADDDHLQCLIPAGCDYEMIVEVTR
jgi:hypothetical protein